MARIGRSRKSACFNGLRVRKWDEPRTSFTVMAGGHFGPRIMRDLGDRLGQNGEFACRHAAQKNLVEDCRRIVGPGIASRGALGFPAALETVRKSMAAGF